MSDIYIPGFTNKYNSNESIKKIMDAKKVKLEKMENEKKELLEEKKAWEDIKSKILSLQSKAKKLYGFEAPFDDKVSQSSNENAFSATVNKNAEIGEYSIEIKQKAKGHKIASSQLPKNYKIPGGEYSFTVGNDNVKIMFTGGTLSDFVDAIRKNSKDLLRSTIASDTSQTQVLIIETVKQGENVRINFGNDKTKEVFFNMGFFENIIGFDKRFKFDNNDSILLKQNDVNEIKITEPIEYKSGLVMEIDMKLYIYDPEKKEKEEIPTGPNFSRKGGTIIYNIQIEGEPPLVYIPPYEKKEEEKPEEIINDNHFINIITNKRTINLPELDVSETQKKLVFEMKDIINNDEQITGITIFNNNTYKDLEAANLRIYDKESLGGIKFKNELASPQNAEIIFEGLKISRESNTIDDLIKGVTLNIFDKTEKIESLKIDRDYNKIVKTISDFLADYNVLLDDVNNKTKIEGKEYVSEEDKENIGRFANEQGLKSLISKLRIIMMNNYTTQYASELSSLYQIGISTNESGKGFDLSKMKGILELSENKLISMLEKYPEGVKQLFGRDTDGDYLIDSGVAFEVERLLKLYSNKGDGYIDTKKSGIDQKVERQNKAIEDYKKQLEKDERDLKEKFYKMEKAAKELEENTKQFDNFNRQR